jgi:hypothetical protein
MKTILRTIFMPLSDSEDPAFFRAVEYQMRCDELRDLMRAGDFKKAMAIAGSLLPMKIDLFGPEHSETAIGHRNLAWCCEENGLYEQAIQHYQEAVRICLKAHGVDHPRTQQYIQELDVLKAGHPEIAPALSEEPNPREKPAQSGEASPQLPASAEAGYYILQINQLPHGGRDIRSAPVVGLCRTTRPGTSEEEVAVVLLQDLNGAEPHVQGFIVPAKALRPLSPGEANAIVPFNALAADRIRRAIGKGVEDSKVLCSFMVNLRETANNASARQTQASLAQLPQFERFCD